jgi:hypothetical protein
MILFYVKITNFKKMSESVEEIIRTIVTSGRKSKKVFQYLYNPGIKVIEAVGVDKKKEYCHCAWTVKYRH